MKKIFMFLILSLILIGSASASDYLLHKQNTPFDLVVQSNNATQCNLSYIQTPNGIKSIFNIPMNKDTQTFSYSLTSNNYTQLGDICHGVVCSDGTNTETGNVCRTITTSGFNTDLFLLIFILIITLIFIIGSKLENTWIMTFGSILVLIFGFFIIKFGIGTIKDTQTTWAIGIIIWAIGLYFLYLSIEEQLKNWS